MTPIVEPISPITPPTIIEEVEYYVIEEALTWHDSVKACEENGDHLTSITDPNENAKVLNVLEETFEKPKSMNFWIGMNQAVGSDNAWKWTDHSEVDYFNWDVRQPTSPPGDVSFNEDCVAIGFGNHMKWHDVGC